MSERVLPASHPLFRRQLAPVPDLADQAMGTVQRLTLPRRAAAWELAIDRVALMVAHLPDVPMNARRRDLLYAICEELERRMAE